MTSFPGLFQAPKNEIEFQEFSRNSRSGANPDIIIPTFSFKSFQTDQIKAGY